MERFPSDSALKKIENELTHGGELAKQLQLLLNAQSSSQETHVYLLNEILNTYNRALSVIEYRRTSGCAGGGASGGAMVAITSDSQGPPLTGSPHSNHSDPEDQACWISGEKRVPGWTQKVIVLGETGNETQLDDGHSWRKYSQKDILRSEYRSYHFNFDDSTKCQTASLMMPYNISGTRSQLSILRRDLDLMVFKHVYVLREYYRCTHGKGCLARKQVQRSDEDPTAYEIAYKGHHTCHNNPPIPIIQPQNELKTPLSHENQKNQSQQEPFLNIQTSLRIIDSSHDEQYNIPSSSNFNPENNPIFSDDQILCEGYLLDFMYPTAQELNYYNGYEGLNNNSQDIEPAAKPPTQDGDS